MYFILVLILMYSVSRYQDITFLGVSNNCSWWNYFTFNICHTTFFHLLINATLFYLYWKILKNITDTRILFVIILLSSILAAIFSKTEIPTIGSSAIVFSMIAALCIAYQILPCKATKKEKIKYYLIIAISLLFPLITNSNLINYKMHIIAFSSSLMLCYIFRNPLYASKK